MPRPMTAEDRDPQVGDVLRYHGRNAMVGRAWPGGDPWRKWVWSYARGRKWYSIPFGGWEHIYVSRADGGPVTVGEGCE